MPALRGTGVFTCRQRASIAASRHRRVRHEGTDQVGRRGELRRRDRQRPRGGRSTARPRPAAATSARGRWSSCWPAPPPARAFDVVLILKKARQPVADCVVEAEAERAAVEPKVFTGIQLTLHGRRPRPRSAPGRARGEAVEGEVLLGDDHARQDRRDHLDDRDRRRRSRARSGPACPGELADRRRLQLGRPRRYLRRGVGLGAFGTSRRDAANHDLGRRRPAPAVRVDERQRPAASASPGSRSCWMPTRRTWLPRYASRVVGSARPAAPSRPSCWSARPGGSTSTSCAPFATGDFAPTSFSASVDCDVDVDHRAGCPAYAGRIQAFSSVDVRNRERRGERRPPRRGAIPADRALIVPLTLRTAARGSGSTCPSARRRAPARCA